MVKKNPEKLFACMSNPRSKINDYKNLEKKYNIQFTPDFYKLIDLQAKFIPQAVKWVKEVDGMNVGGWFTHVWPVMDARDAEQWIESEDVENMVIGVLMDVSQADDPWITYSPAKRGYSFSLGLKIVRKP